jgi:hypothetical protein
VCENKCIDAKKCICFESVLLANNEDEEIINLLTVWKRNPTLDNHSNPHTKTIILNVK